MTNEEMSKIILNKKFKKTAFAGYDTIDVDSFFDLVIQYLDSNDKKVAEYKAILDKIRNDNTDLKKQIDLLTKSNNEKQAKIDTFYAEGYSHVIENRK